MAALPRPVAYDPARVAFNQDQCVVCLNPFENSEVVSELACRHIFHGDCIPERVVHCPTCRYPIEGRIQHQAQRGRSFLQRMFSTDPAALNLRLERRAQRSMFNPLYGTEDLQGVVHDLAIGWVLGDEVASDVRRRADVLFLRTEMPRIRSMNRQQRYLHIYSTGQAARLLELLEDPDLGSELSREVAREFTWDARRAIDGALIALMSVCFLIWTRELVNLFN